MKTLQTISAFALAVFAASATQAFAADDTYNLTLKDHRFSPAGLTIPADKKVKVTVRNLDTTPAEFESDDFKAEKVIPAGKQVDIFIGPLKAGVYEFHDEYHEAESKTKLTVK
ncbi:cupredoxin domain-containing protein [Burkholderia sp. BDU5]|uniref:cupredoxin domain-containing protein n=1 Tax=Burkholderia sp. BDU5 TaxID=1385590 RepID=UPI00075C2D0D|nr:cupredoxin domain-containing protein [Burkholderia sp. BDU5]KVE42074.1 cupredoxin-like domain protein [Burkholderia sp. BDU5]